MNHTLLDTVVDHLSRIYHDQDIQSIAKKAIETMKLSNSTCSNTLHENKWSEQKIQFQVYIFYPSSLIVQTKGFQLLITVKSTIA